MAAPAEGRRRAVRPEGLGDLGDHPRLLRRRRARRSTSRSTRTYELQVDGAADRRDRHRLELAARVARRAAPIRRASLPRHRHARHRSRSRLLPRGAAQRSGADARGPAGRTLATGAIDSPQATLIPLGRLRREGLSPGRGRHGPAVRRAGRQARRSRRRRARRACRASTQGDAAACAMLDLNWDGWIKDGTIDAERVRHRRRRPTVSTTASSPSAQRLRRRGRERRWLDALFAMRYDNPAHREMMDLEGLKAWLPGRTTGFGRADGSGRRRSGSSTATSVVKHSAALSRHDRRQLAAAADGRRGACARYRRGRIDRARVRSRRRRGGGRSAAPAGEARLRHRHRRRAAARQLLLVRRREARRRPADDPRRDARRRRGQGRLRAAPPDARRAGLFDQQPDLRRPDRAARAAGGRRPARSRAATRTGRSRSRCPDRIC